MRTTLTDSQRAIAAQAQAMCPQEPFGAGELTQAQLVEADLAYLASQKERDHRRMCSTAEAEAVQFRLAGGL
jgi:hypothetical protein